MDIEKEEVWFSVDVEADGQSQIINSMISLGICVLDSKGNELDSLKVNIFPRKGCVQDPDTMKWWETQGEAWALCQENQMTPAAAMWELSLFYSKWSAEHKVKWVAQPACYDFGWITAYYNGFPSVGTVPIGFFCYDFSTLRKMWLKQAGNALMDVSYEEMRAEWTEGATENSHCALEDARFQGREFLGFMNMWEATQK